MPTVAKVTVHLPPEHDGDTAVTAEAGTAVVVAASPTAASAVSGVTDRAIRRITPGIEDSSFASFVEDIDARSAILRWRVAPSIT